MHPLELADLPIAETGMLVRRSARDVYNAFVDPNVTTQFWFTRSSGRLVAGREVEWVWDMYNFSVMVQVVKLDEDRQIVVTWPGPHGSTTVQWDFEPLSDSETFVTVRNFGFQGTGDEIVQQALGSVEGFSIVLAGLKAYLEHGIRLNLVADRFPSESTKP